MIENGKYGEPAITCLPAHGICTKNQECSTCFYAERYEYYKTLFEFAGKCEWKKGIECTRFEKECKAEECRILLCRIELQKQN